MKPLGKALLGALTFCASRHRNEECGINGLPLTPNSIRILGYFQKLTTFHHPNLSLYLDLVRGKHERVFVVFEYYENNLSHHAKLNFTTDDIIRIIHDVLLALDYLDKNGMIHGCLAPKYILLNEEGRAVVSNYGHYYMTECGSTIQFPIGLPKYMAPEIFYINEFTKKDESKPWSQDSKLSKSVFVGIDSRSDVWSLGVIALELSIGVDFWSDINVDETVRRILGFVMERDVHPVDVFLEDLKFKQVFQGIPLRLQSFITKCLSVLPSQRPSISNLLQDDLFKDLDLALQLNSIEEQVHEMFPTKLRSEHLLSPSDEMLCEELGDFLSERGMDEVYYLWKLAGGEVEGTFKKLGRLSRRPPIMNLPCYVSADGEMFGSVHDSSTLFDDSIVVLPQHQLRQRLKDLDERDYFLLLEFNNFSTEENPTLLPFRNAYDFKETAKLPLIIKENDVEYQFHRIILFKRLLDGYPFKKQQILKECRVDVPPLFRAKLWAALLEIEGDVVGRYESIDKNSPSATDRQIEVDIPRCHQYNPLLSSPMGHHKFKRILKAWVASHPEYVYWQGLDSLCAPFLYLNFNDEAIAFACLCAFIPKYLHNFFLKDNAQVIQEYLAVFSHLIAFHDPTLFNHLDSIGFIPDLYSIPWFLTMYAHVFPLNKIFHLWDTLMLGNSSFPLCIGVAILKQLRDQLLTFSFNECILLFSDMPEIDIERCVQDSIQIFRSTPKSITFRIHDGKAPTQKITTRSMFTSFYSKDHHNSPKTHLSIDAIPLDELRAEKCARIAAEDLIELMGLHSSVMSPSKKSRRNSKPVIAVLDVRPSVQFQSGFIPNSINIPYAEAFTPDGVLASSEVSNFLLQHRNAVKVVLGDSALKEDLMFAEKLIQFGHSKVCILHKGIDIIKTEGLLTGTF